MSSGDERVALSGRVSMVSENPYAPPSNNVVQEDDGELIGPVEVNWSRRQVLCFRLAAISVIAMPLLYMAFAALYVYLRFAEGVVLNLVHVPSRLPLFVIVVTAVALISTSFVVWVIRSPELTWTGRFVWGILFYFLNIFIFPFFLRAKYRGAAATTIQRWARPAEIKTGIQSH